MAIHTGEAIERDGDYFGTAVNRVARLMSIGHGGQVLLSGRTHAMIDAALPSMNDPNLLMRQAFVLITQAVEPQVKAFNSFDEPDALAQAAASDARRMAPSPDPGSCQ